MAKSHPEHLSEAAAEELAKRIAQFWHSQGHTGVRVWTEKIIPAERLGRANSFCVRSNLVRGYPQA